MNFIRVDENKCTRDGYCVAACPFGIIEIQNGNAMPTPRSEIQKKCIKCGHCVAVCEHGALSHRAMTPEQCPPVNNESLPSPGEIEHVLRARRSIRNFKVQAVEKDLIVKLIDITRHAPSGRNSQPVNWLVIHDNKEVRRLAGFVIDWMRNSLKEDSPLPGGMGLDLFVSEWEAGNDFICHGAPHLIITHAPQESRPATSACTIALTYLELAAFSFGLGTCWLGIFRNAATVWSPLQEALKLPEGHTTLGAMSFGYPKIRYRRLPLRNDARITWR